MTLPVTANTNVSIMAFKSAGSSSPARKTEWKVWNATSSATLKTGSAACLAASVAFSVSLSRKIANAKARTYGDSAELLVSVNAQQVYLVGRPSLPTAREVVMEKRYGRFVFPCVPNHLPVRLKKTPHANYDRTLAEASV
jgi:hypothetical protein